MTKLERAAPLVLAVLLTALLLKFSGLVTHVGVWYSYYPTYILQSQALLDGHLWIARSLAGWVNQDWAFGPHGMEQIWGLGVPLLRAPFDLLARAAGQLPFSDRLFFLGCSMFVATFSLATLSRVLPREVSAPTRWTLLLGAGWTLFLYPWWINLFTNRFNGMAIWSEAVAYNCLIGLFSYFVLLRSATGRGNPPLWVIGAVAGFTILIKPTGVFFLGAALAVALLKGLRTRTLKRRELLLLCAAVGAELAFLFVTNTLRFGRPWEFGHGMVIGGPLDTDLYALRFNSPFFQAPLWAKLKDLWATIVIAPEGSSLWTVSPRTRELHFRHVGIAALLFAGAGFGLSVFDFLHRRRTGRHSALETHLALSSLWALMALAGLCGFYLNTFTISSRYLTELAPPLSLLTANGFLVMGVRIAEVTHFGRRTRAGASLLLTALVVGLCLWQTGGIGTEIMTPPQVILTPEQQSIDGNRLWATLLRADAENGKSPDFAAPEAVTCPWPDAEPEFLRRWDLTRSCETGIITEMILKASPCIVVELNRSEAFNADLQFVRVKANLEELVEVSRMATPAHQVSVKFCQKNTPGAPRTRPQLVTVAFAKVEDLATNDMVKARPHVLLTAVRATER